MIAAALIAEPDILIADEPTTALDVTVQAQILDLLERIREETGLLLITHDLAVVAGHCERVLVMDEGRIVEAAQTRQVFSNPESDRAREMIAAAPRFDTTSSPEPVTNDVLLEVDDATVSYRERESGKQLLAVQDLGFELREGETLAVQRLGAVRLGDAARVQAARDDVVLQDVDQLIAILGLQQTLDSAFGQL